MEWENVVAGQRADPEQINKIGNQVAKYKGLCLARRVVLTEAVSVIEFNADSDGTALNSTLGGELLFYSGANSSMGGVVSCYMQCNGITTGGYWNHNAAVADYWVIGSVATQYSKNQIILQSVNGNIIAGSNFTYRHTSSGGSSVGGGGMIAPQTAITAIKLFLSAGTFPAGTTIEWWERG